MYMYRYRCVYRITWYLVYELCRVNVNVMSYEYSSSICYININSITTYVYILDWINT